MKRLFTLMFLAASASVAMAQSQKLIQGNHSFDATLAEFSADGKAHVYLRNEDYDTQTTTFTFYSDDLDKESELVINADKVTFTSKHEELQGGTWTVLNNETGESSYGIIKMYLDDLSSSCDDYRSVYITQTLFNTDGKYEYLMPVIEAKIETMEFDTNGDGVNDVRDTFTSSKMIGFKIVSEDGTTLQTVNFDGGFYTSANSKDYFTLTKINGKLYLTIEGRIGEDDYLLVYAVNSSPSSVSLKRMEKFSSTSAVYDLSGRQTNGHKGINIVRSGNGETKKVFVK